MRVKSNKGADFFAHAYEGYLLRISEPTPPTTQTNSIVMSLKSQNASVIAVHMSGYISRLICIALTQKLVKVGGGRELFSKVQVFIDGST